MRAIAVLLIVFYQRYLSPYKGYRCAHAVYHGGLSCSAAVRVIVEREGLWRGWSLIRRRFAECRVAAEDLRRETEEEKRRRQQREREQEWERERRRQRRNRCGSCSESCGDGAGDVCGDASCAVFEGIECGECAVPDCGGVDCVPGDCSVSLSRRRLRRAAQPAQGS